jgi:hypothetical protein
LKKRDVVFFLQLLARFFRTAMQKTTAAVAMSHCDLARIAAWPFLLYMRDFFNRFSREAPQD